MRIRFMLTGAALAFAAPFAAANAAPQMLGLVATNSPTPLTCTDGLCTAELSTFCLQEQRDMPLPGTAYQAVDTSKVILVARLADGREIRRPIGDAVHMTVARAQFAVDISVPADTVNEMGAESVSVEIAPLASAAPVPVAGDPDPLSEGEIAAAAGPMREVAGHIATTGGPNGTAAVITNRLINVLVADDEGREGLWERSVGRQYALDSFEPGVKRAAEYYKICQTMPDAGEVRRCLQHAHDGYMGRLNIDYWNVVGGGS